MSRPEPPPTVLRARAGRSGMALVVTLGILTVLLLLAVAFTVTTRTERFASRNYRDRATARHFVDVAMQLAMDCARGHQRTTVGIFSYADWWSAEGAANLSMVSGQCVGGWPSATPATYTDRLFRASAAAWVPNALAAQASNTWSEWQYIIGTNEYQVGTTTNGRVAFLVIDCTGFLDVHAISNTHARVLTDDVRDPDSFAPLPDPATAGATFISQADLNTRGPTWGLHTPVSNLVACIFDPGPEVTVTNWAALGLPSIDLVPKYNLLLWTNAMSDTSDRSDQSDRYRLDPPRAWLEAVTNRLLLAGFEEPQAIAWNLLNFMDTDRVPQSDRAHPWQEDYPVEDVPLINEIALLEVPSTAVEGRSNHYAVAVELWYPFVPGRIDAADAAELVVGVFTNDPAATRPTIDAMLDADTRGDFGYARPIDAMAYGTATEFAVVSNNLPDEAIAFPVTIVYPAGPFGAPPARIETAYLPIGPASYPVYTRISDDPDVVETAWIHLTNEVRVLARVQLNGQWVDEATGYDPADYDRPETPESRILPVFRRTWSLSIDDPRRNGRPSAWRRDSVDAPGWLTLGTTNANCNPWQTRYSQGLPLVHFNGPLRTAGDIGFIANTTTSVWESICLADDRNMRLDADLNAIFVRGSVLDFFTTRATNAPVRNRMHYGSPWTNVVRAVMADVTFGWTAPVLDWMTASYLNSRHAVQVYTNDFIHGGITPTTLGEMAFGLGLSDLYADGPDELSWEPSRGSVGDDIKEEMIRGLAERISFRQNLFVIVVTGQTLTPAGRVAADQRAVVTVAADAFSGQWHVLNWHWLTE